MPERNLLLSTSEAAANLGVSDARIRQLILEGRLPAVRLGNTWGIEPGDWERFRALVRPPGRPRDGAAPGGVVPRLPSPQRALLEAHEHFLRDAINWLSCLDPRPTMTVAETMMVSLAVRVIQLGRALQAQCQAGYAGEAAPIARAMLSGAMTLVCIADADSDARAVAYLHHEEYVRKKRIADLIKQSKEAHALGQAAYFSEEELRQIIAEDAELTKINAAKFSAFAAKGITPKKLGSRKDTWHGLDDRGLFEAMGAAEWYLSYYRLFSDDGHVTANSLYTEFSQRLAGHVDIGPRYEDPIHLIGASGKAIPETLSQVNRSFGAGSRADVLALKQRLDAAVREYKRSSN